MSRTTPRRSWSTAVLALVVALALLGACVGAYRRDALLATNGKGALATVMSYEPRKSRYTKGTTTSHDHVLSFDGIVENVTLPRPQAPGMMLRIVYLPDNPEIVALGAPGMSAWQLMGGDAFWVILAGLAGSGLLVFSVWALYGLTSDAAAAAHRKR
jgi:hypothetical protein